jgi:putative ABC transport system permease protein
LYIKLAVQNIRNNRNTFYPFAFSCIAMVAMFYMLAGICPQIQRNTFTGASSMWMVLDMGLWVCGIFSAVVILYTNSFLMKRRSREFGLYSILGMDKRHIGKVVFWEMFLTGAASILLGLLAGILFSKLMFLILLSLVKIETELTFLIAPGMIGLTALLFAGIFAVVLLVNRIRIARLRPLELLSSAKAGEREPKANWFFAILGFGCLGYGYYLALTTENPITALSHFFVAVLFVIAGTYLLFVSGSIALLKVLKKNKRYYYHKNHFVTVSGLMYRMKQNAVGLASICILSTMALVTISTTVSLYAGMQNLLRTRFPHDIHTTYNYEEDGAGSDYSILAPAMEARAAEYHVSLLEEESYYTYYAYGGFDGKTYHSVVNANQMAELQVVCLADYNERTGESVELDDDQVLVCAQGGCKTPQDSLWIEDREYRVTGTADPDGLNENWEPTLNLVVKDMDAMKDIRDSINATMESGYTVIHYTYDFNLSGTMEDKQAFCEGLRDALNATGIAHLGTVENIFTSVSDFYQMYGSLFFIGIFIGTMFLLATAMIIYYKQISEGYDDRERFVILQKVGMSSREVKKTITSQILLVFFLPILFAIVHICFAFDTIRKILYMLNLSNAWIFAGGTAAVVAVFILGYAIVYRLTARAYYRIVQS